MLAEVENPYGFNVLVARYCSLIDSPTSTKRIEIANPNGFNITPAAHYGVDSVVGTLQLTRDPGVAALDGEISRRRDLHAAPFT